MKNTRIVAFALCLMLCLPGYAEKKSKKKVESESTSSETRLRIDEGGYKHEILVNGGSQTLGQSGAMFSFGNATAITAAAAYNYDVIPMLQIGLFPSLTYLSVGGASATAFTILAGPTLNLSMNGDIQDAFFLSGAAGIQIVSSATAFAFRFDLGKRFKIWDHISYEPSFGIMKVGSGGAQFIFNLMSGSVHF